MPSTAARTPARPVRDLLNGDGPPQPMPYVIRVLRPPARPPVPHKQAEPVPLTAFAGCRTPAPPKRAESGRRRSI
ncbi:hypothetical protein GCM10010205_66840 [Streptomyces nojiriensis]|nr:hypothetical protein GCM10010205_66840 [Streptomyces nojiriensis]